MKTSVRSKAAPKTPKSKINLDNVKFKLAPKLKIVPQQQSFHHPFNKYMKPHAPANNFSHIRHMNMRNSRKRAA
jgi:hypothetical protein